MTAVDRSAPDAGRPDAGASWVISERRRPWLLPVATGVAVAAGTIYTAVNNPNDPNNHAFPLCPLKYVTGWDCPACGCLRATHALAHGRIGEAFDHNVLFTALVPLVVLGWVMWLGRSLGYRLPRLRIPSWTPAAVMLGAVAFGVVRNLPIPGHAFLFSA